MFTELFLGGRGGWGLFLVVRAGFDRMLTKNLEKEKGRWTVLKREQTHKIR